MKQISLSCGCGHSVPVRGFTKRSYDEAFIELEILHGKTREEAIIVVQSMNKKIEKMKKEIKTMNQAENKNKNCPP